MKVLYSLIIVFITTQISAQPFSAADDLGRVLPQQKEVGDIKAGKHVGMFYFLWQGDDSSPTSDRYWDLTKIYQSTPEVFQDFHHQEWGSGSSGVGKYYFWGESIYGYYRGDDYWVHLKNVQLLTDAGVDFLIIDATNRLTYTRQSEILMKALAFVRKQGKKSPKIVFYTNTASGDAMQEIYDNFYADKAPYRHPDNWFFLEGKPLIIGLSEQAKGRDYKHFFTIRESQWPNEPQKVNGWPWIEFQRPQRVFKNHKGEKEVINVSIAQHPNLQASMGGSAFYGELGNWGRSFRHDTVGDPSKDLLYGYNAQEQWDFALEQDVPFIFVTGWNEWIAGKWLQKHKDGTRALFVDQASPEFSRDIEPSRTAGLKDTYYMQLISYIRKYKGVDSPIYINSGKLPKKIADWNNITPIYTDYIGDILHRNHPAAVADPTIIYKNETGRNDLHILKIASSSKDLMFYVQTVNNIGPQLGDNWMTLWLNTDQSYDTGWYGYDFRIIQGNTLQQYQHGKWYTTGTVNYQVQGNEMVIRIPYTKLKLPSKNTVVEFKWSDNMQEADPLDWYLNGDAAPGGRLNMTIHVKKQL